MKTCTFTVPGIPTAKSRPRFTRAGHAYTPARTLEAEATILSSYLACPDRPETPWEGPVRVSIEAVFPIPKSWPKWKRERLWYPHTSRPDGDNLVKAVCDSLNGVAWRDDAQVWDVTLSKVYGEWAGLHCLLAFEDPPQRELAAIQAPPAKDAIDLLDAIEAIESWRAGRDLDADSQALAVRAWMALREIARRMGAGA